MFDQPLPDAARQAWQAYNAMDATRQRHFLVLQGLEAKYKKYGSASESEQALLARLLRDHDEQVARFKRAIGELARTDAAANAALIEYIGALNAALGAFQPATEEAGPAS
jgi:hypothetical protein